MRQQARALAAAPAPGSQTSAEADGKESLRATSAVCAVCPLALSRDTVTVQADGSVRIWQTDRLGLEREAGLWSVQRQTDNTGPIYLVVDVGMFVC